ncbi:protein Fe65 isoform X5 [Apis mellifera caucasica]|nr:protein Fe65 isoform X5 [Apis mellifera caucasica]KAG9435265.1 protein Fe65 isoform X5 [Apis mellifera carnica]
MFVTENGLLSFENPNYHLDPARLDDALNSNENGSSLYDELYQELVGNGGRSGEVTGGGGGGGGTRVQARRTYATLDLGSMGVDVTQGPLTQDSVTEDAQDNTDNHNLG